MLGGGRSHVPTDGAKSEAPCSHFTLVPTPRPVGGEQAMLALVGVLCLSLRELYVVLCLFAPFLCSSVLFSLSIFLLVLLSLLVIC